MQHHIQTLLQGMKCTRIQETGDGAHQYKPQLASRQEKTVQATHNTLPHQLSALHQHQVHTRYTLDTHRHTQVLLGVLLLQ